MIRALSFVSSSSLGQIRLILPLPPDLPRLEEGMTLSWEILDPNQGGITLIILVKGPLPGKGKEVRGKDGLFFPTRQPSGAWSCGTTEGDRLTAVTPEEMTTAIISWCRKERPEVGIVAIFWPSEPVVEDSSMGDWVYCCQHHRPHRTGWCTVPKRMKIRLGTTGGDDEANKRAYEECRRLGLHIYGEMTPWDGAVQDALAEACDGRHYHSWLAPNRAERDRLLAMLAGQK